MKILRDHAHSGEEFDWLACDAHDLCFILATAGYGWLPENACAPSYPGDVLALVLALPIRGGVLMRGNQGRSTDWSDAAQRGFFAFDWDHARERYTLIAEPLVPILAADLPLEIKRVVLQAQIEMNSISAA